MNKEFNTKLKELMQLVIQYNVANDLTYKYDKERMEIDDKIHKICGLYSNDVAVAFKELSCQKQPDKS